MVAPQQLLRTLRLLESRGGRLPIEILEDRSLALHRRLAAGEVAVRDLIVWLQDLMLAAVEGGELAITALGRAVLSRTQHEEDYSQIGTATLAAPACRDALRRLVSRVTVTRAGQVILTGSITDKERGLLFLYRRLGLADSMGGTWTFYGEIGTFLVQVVDIGLHPEELYRRLTEQRELGELGEEIAFRAERERLIMLGAHQQANRVRRVSLENVAAGYDILSFNGANSVLPDRFIEVKTTPRITPHFFISAAELRKARELRQDYHLVCVTGVNLPTRTHTGFFEFRDPVLSVFESEKFKVEPSSFEVTWIGS